MSISREGCKLEDMGRLATDLGFNASIVKLSPQSLGGYGFPLIAHFETDGLSTGHYVVVLGCSGSHVAIIDGTSGNRRDMPRVEFTKKWTGYALVGRPKAGLMANLIILLGFSFITLQLAKLLMKAKAKRRHHQIRYFFISLLCISWQSVRAKGQDLLSVADEIDAQWSRVTQFEVKYSATTKALADPGRIRSILMVDYLVQANRTYAFKGSKRYFEQSDLAVPLLPSLNEAPRNTLRKNNLYTYDGIEPIIRYMNTRANIFTTTSLDNKAYSSDRRIFDQEYLHLLYRSVPNVFSARRSTPVVASSLSDKLRAGAFRFVGFDHLEGVRCMRVQEENMQTVDILWLNPALHFAMVKRQTHKRGIDQAASITTFGKHRAVNGSLSIPYVITTYQYYDIERSEEFPRVPLVQHVITVNECRTSGLPDTMFLYEPPPGTPAIGDADGSRVSYRVPANEKQLDAVLADMNSGNYGDSRGKTVARMILWITLSGVSSLLVMILYLWFRRRSSR